MVDTIEEPAVSMQVFGIIGSVLIRYVYGILSEYMFGIYSEDTGGLFGIYSRKTRWSTYT